DSSGSARCDSTRAAGPGPARHVWSRHKTRRRLAGGSARSDGAGGTWRNRRSYVGRAGGASGRAARRAFLSVSTGHTQKNKPTSGNRYSSFIHRRILMPPNASLTRSRFEIELPILTRSSLTCFVSLPAELLIEGIAGAPSRSRLERPSLLPELARRKREVVADALRVLFWNVQTLFNALKNLLARRFALSIGADPVR